jgi:hypothetical protein
LGIRQWAMGRGMGHGTSEICLASFYFHCPLDKRRENECRDVALLRLIKDFGIT